MPTQDELQLLGYLERLRQEGLAGKEQTDLAKADDWLKLARGEQWPENLPKGFIDFTLNLVNDVIQRKTGLLTDSRPVLQVFATNSRDLKLQTEMIEKVLQALWDEVTWQEELARGIAMASVVGSNVAIMRWDPLADGGRGDLRPRFFDPRSVSVDPSVVRPTDLPLSEFVITEEVRSKPSLIEQFGARAMDVKADADLSSFPDTSSRRGGLMSAAAGLFRRARTSRTKTLPGVIDRAFCRHYWFKDWLRQGDGRPIFSQPRQIRHVVGAGGVVLVDEPNPFWHGGYPHEILDWGMELEHPWGQSEVKQLRKAQEALNSIVSDILKNAKRMGSFKIIGDINALDPDGWDAISSEAAIKIRKRPGSFLEMMPPPALPAYLFQLVQFLVTAVEMISGLSEVTRGTPPSADSSGIAIEGLQVAAQTIIRLQSRRLEAFLQRFWSKSIPCIFQYYTGTRVKSLIGPGGMADIFIFEKSAFEFGLADPMEAFRDFVLHVIPGSALAATRVQKAVLAGNLYRMQLLPGIEVLKAVEWQDPEGTLKAATEEVQQRLQAQTAAQTPGVAGLAALVGGRRSLQSFPAGGQMGG